MNTLREAAQHTLELIDNGKMLDIRFRYGCREVLRAALLAQPDETEQLSALLQELDAKLAKYEAQPDHSEDNLEMVPQPEQEPVAWLTDRAEMYFDKEDAYRYSDGFIQPLYTAPPQREPILYDEWAQHTYTKVLMEQVKDLSAKIAPQRAWQGLTDEEVKAEYMTHSPGVEWACGGLDDAYSFARAIEAKLKEKNT